MNQVRVAIPAATAGQPPSLIDLLFNDRSDSCIKSCTFDHEYLRCFLSMAIFSDPDDLKTIQVVLASKYFNDFSAKDQSLFAILSRLIRQRPPPASATSTSVKTDHRQIIDIFWRDNQALIGFASRLCSDAGGGVEVDEATRGDLAGAFIDCLRLSETNLAVFEKLFEKIRIFVFARRLSLRALNALVSSDAYFGLIYSDNERIASRLFELLAQLMQEHSLLIGEIDFSTKKQLMDEVIYRLTNDATSSGLAATCFKVLNLMISSDAGMRSVLLERYKGLRTVLNARYRSDKSMAKALADFNNVAAAAQQVGEGGGRALIEGVSAKQLAAIKALINGSVTRFRMRRRRNAEEVELARQKALETEMIERERWRAGEEERAYARARQDLQLRRSAYQKQLIDRERTLNDSAAILTRLMRKRAARRRLEQLRAVKEEDGQRADEMAAMEKKIAEIENEEAAIDEMIDARRLPVLADKDRVKIVKEAEREREMIAARMSDAQLSDIKVVKSRHEEAQDLLAEYWRDAYSNRRAYHNVASLTNQIDREISLIDQYLPRRDSIGGGGGLASMSDETSRMFYVNDLAIQVAARKSLKTALKREGDAFWQRFDHEADAESEADLMRDLMMTKKPSDSR